MSGLRHARYGIETYVDFDATWATFAAGEHEVDVNGINTWKLQDDLVRYARIVKKAKPDLIIEVGTKWGGSALWFSCLGVDVISVDIDHSLTGPAMEIDASRDRPRIQLVTGDSIGGHTLAEVMRLSDGYKRVMVVLDGEHAAPHVLKEIIAYGSLVSVGQHLVVEDGIFDLADPKLSHLGGARIPNEGGPLLAIAQSGLATDPAWRRDTAVEKMSPKTYHVGGWWRRVAV
jgi:cephalosporin hydroxylase